MPGQVLKLATNAGAGNGAAVKTEIGGRFLGDAMGTWGGGNVQLQRLGPDGSTWLNYGAAITANGAAAVELAPGSYRAVVTTATGVYYWLTEVA